MEKGVAAFKECNYAEAEIQLAAALREAERMHLPDSSLLIIIALLVSVYNMTDKQKEAELLCDRLLAALAGMPASGSDISPEVANVLHTLANFYAKQRKYAEAEALS